MKADLTYWNATANSAPFPQLTGTIQVDVAIVGGGIVGVTAARLMKDQGLTVAVVEARRVGRQVTGKSTAKLTSQHGLVYQNIEKTFGEQRARLYGQAQEAGIRKLVELAARHGIDADIEPMPAFIYTLGGDAVSTIEKEAEVARRLGLPASLTRATDLPFDVHAALRFDDQAQIHPVKYVAGLAATIPGEGSHVFEQSRVVEWDPRRVTTERGSVSARHVVMATHLPLGQIGLYYAMAYPRAETVAAARLGRAPHGMYMSADLPSRSIRTHRWNGETYGIAAGTAFKPGHPREERQHGDELERWLAEMFDAGAIAYRWVNEDYKPMDGLPFVGWSSSKTSDAYLVATGFNAWGISNGTVAAMIMADLVGGRDNPWLEVFDATRVKPLAGAKDFISENLSVAAHLVGGFLSRKLTSYDDLRPGEASILKIDGENVAAFKDEQGTVHAVSAACTHMGCLLGWNTTDRTWDCHCHGSRFAATGEVMHGPAVQPLAKKL